MMGGGEKERAVARDSSTDDMEWASEFGVTLGEAW